MKFRVFIVLLSKDKEIFISFLRLQKTEGFLTGAGYQSLFSSSLVATSG
jgi:hypothetical protein